MASLADRRAVLGPASRPQCPCGSRNLRREGIAWKASTQLDYILAGYRCYECLRCGAKLYN